MLKIDVKVDYIRVTSKHIDVKEFKKTGTIERPMYGYDECTEISYDGSVVGQHMSGLAGELIQISGKGLDRLRRAGMSDENTLRVLRGTKTTRIDIAIDIRAKPEPVLKNMYEQLQSGRVKTLAKSFATYQSYNPDMGYGTTVSLGSRKSDRYFRGYNKTVESALTEWIVRLEMETKGVAAKRLPDDIASQGLTQTTGALFADFAMFDGFYERVINQVGRGELTKIRPVKTDDEKFFRKSHQAILISTN